MRNEHHPCTALYQAHNDRCNESALIDTELGHLFAVELKDRRRAFRQGDKAACPIPLFPSPCSSHDVPLCALPAVGSIRRSTVSVACAFRRAIGSGYSRRMPVSDLDIARLVHQWIALRSDEAIARAREMIEAMRAKGDTEGADAWLRIIAAITMLGTPPTEARH